MATYNYQNVAFRLDIIGLDIWRWTILPESPGGMTLIGQVVGSKEHAVSHCRSEIDKALVWRAEAARGNSDRGPMGQERSA